MKKLVEIKDVSKIYNPGENEVRALNHVSLTIGEGEFVAIIGQSGSGICLGDWIRQPVESTISMVRTFLI